MRLLTLLSMIVVTSCVSRPATLTSDHVLRTETTEETQALEEKLRPAIEEATRTYPEARRRFLAGFRSGEQFFVTVRLADDIGSFEQVFVLVDTIKDEVITGRVWSEVLTLTAISQGQEISIAEGHIVDWTIVHANGTEEGNFVGKLIDKLQGKSH